MIRDQLRLDEGERRGIDDGVAALTHTIGRDTAEFDQRQRYLNDQQRRGHFGPAAIAALLPRHNFVVLAGLEHVYLRLLNNDLAYIYECAMQHPSRRPHSRLRRRPKFASSSP